MTEWGTCVCLIPYVYYPYIIVLYMLFILFCGWHTKGNNNKSPTIEKDHRKKPHDWKANE